MAVLTSLLGAALVATLVWWQAGSDIVSLARTAGWWTIPLLAVWPAVIVWLGRDQLPARLHLRSFLRRKPRQL